MSDNPRRGAVHATAAAASFACMGAFAKAASQHGANEAVMVFARNVVCVLALLPWVLARGWAALKTSRPGGHLWRSTFGLLGMYTLNYAFTHLKLAEALLLNYASPLFIPFIAWMVLGERPPRFTIPATFLGLAGVALVVKPFSFGWSTAALVGASSGIFAACAMVSLRRISDTEPAQRVVFYFALFGLCVSAIPLIWFGQRPAPMELLMLIGLGLAATNGQLQLTKAYAHAPAARIGAMGYSAVIFVGLIGWLFWGEKPDGYSLLGAALVIATCVLASGWSVRKPVAITPEDASS